MTYEIQSAKNGETIELFEAADDEEAIEHARRETPGNWNLFRLVASNDSEFGFEFKGEGPPPMRDAIGMSSPEPGWHLKLVLVVTALEQSGKPTTRLSLCTRLEGERAEVDKLVEDLVQRGRVKCNGEFVLLKEWV